jgi:hypothetical protein
MATVGSARTNAFWAASRALDRAIESATGGRPIHPSGTTFVPANLADSERLSAYRRRGPVSVVDADGNETRLPMSRASDVIVGLAILGLIVWAVVRRPSVSA